MFRYLNLRREEDQEKDDDLDEQNDDDLNTDDEPQDDTDQEQDGNDDKDTNEGGDDPDEPDEQGEENKDDDTEKDDKDNDDKGEEESDGDDEKSDDASESDSGDEDANDSVADDEPDESDKAPQQPTSEPNQTYNGDPDVKDVNSQPEEISGAEVTASGADVSAHSPTVVIAGFPGIGKTTFASQRDDVKDLESSLYSKKADGSKNPDFPGNYVNMVKWHLVNNNWKYLLVSTHEDVRKALTDDGINFFIIYPDKTRKDEFLKLYKERGNTDEFIQLMDSNWEDWIDEIAKATKSYALKDGEFLSDELFNTSLKFLKQ